MNYALEGTKIVAADEMARLENDAILEGLCPEKFMMTAAANLATAIEALAVSCSKPKKITLISGKGNNGGDGYATALHLLAKGFEVKAFYLYSVEMCSPLNRKFFRLLSSKIPVEKLEEDSAFEESFILDAILGTGCKGELDPFLQAVIEKINSSHQLVLSLDIPSGLDGNLGVLQPHIVKAHTTLYLELAKTGFFIEGGFKYVGQLQHVEFGLPQKFKDRALAFGYLFNETHLKDLLPQMERTQHKYERGYVVGLSGSPGMSGAALLASLAAMRSGAGIVRLFHRCSLQELALQKFPELIAMPWDPDNKAEFLDEEQRACALFMGPGLGKDPHILQQALDLLVSCSKPCVIDADLIEPFSQDTRKFTSEIILTPHRQEMAKCLSLTKALSDEDFLEQVQGFVEEKKVTVVLKGAPTFIHSPKKPLLVMIHGDKGMATAGSGDVLTGVIAGLLSRGLRPKEAAALGVYIHAKAGELAATKTTSQSMIASDILEHLCAIFLQELT